MGKKIIDAEFEVISGPRRPKHRLTIVQRAALWAWLGLMALGIMSTLIFQI